MKLLSQSSVLTLKISDVVPVPERGFQTSLAVSVTCGGDNRVVEGATWSPSSSAGPPASRVCEVGPEQCRKHEICRPANEKSRSGAACATVLRGQTRAAAASRPPPPPCPSLPRPHCPSNCSSRWRARWCSCPPAAPTSPPWCLHPPAPTASTT